MSFGSKKEQEARKAQALQQQRRDENDKKLIRATIDALIGCDPKDAREIIKRPADLLPLVTNGNQNTSCLYAMHALVFPLEKADKNEILNGMTDDEISKLKQCISYAQGYAMPDKELVIAEINIRNEEQKTGKEKKPDGTKQPLSPQKRVFNERILPSLRIMAQVADKDVWELCVAELQKWQTTIETFKRDPKQAPAPKKEPEHVAKSADELWTLKELAEQLNKDGIECEVSQIYNHIKRIKKKNGDHVKAQILAWFNFDTKPITIKAINYEDYRDLFSKVRVYAPRKAKTVTPKSKQKAMDMLWTIPQLAEYLGTTTKKIHNHIARCLKSKNTYLIRKINKWFVFETTPKGNKRAHAICDSCVEAYKKEFAKIRSYNRKAKPVEAKPVIVTKKPAPVATVEPVAATEPKTMLDVKALEAQLAALVKLYDNADTEMSNAKLRRLAIQAQIGEQTDNDEKIEELSEKLQTEIANIKKYAAIMESLRHAKELSDKLTNAKTVKEDAQKALDKAESELESVNAEIATLLAQSKQNKR